jgi:predicted nucleic acid-binding protein
MVIVDTTVWIDYLNGVTSPQTEWLERTIEAERVGLTDISVCEILQGLQTDQQAASVLRELLKFEVFTLGGVELAAAAAQNYRVLRARGRTVRKTIDCLIATFCIRNQHSLLHADHDFEPFEKWLKLQVVHV